MTEKEWQPPEHIRPYLPMDCYHSVTLSVNDRFSVFVSNYNLTLSIEGGSEYLNTTDARKLARALNKAVRLQSNWPDPSECPKCIAAAEYDAEMSKARTA